MEAKIVLLPGDGIGPEVVKEAVKVLHHVAKQYDHTFTYEEKYIGGIALDKYGVSLPEETIEACKTANAIVLGAVGGPVGNHRWNQMPNGDRPEKGILKIRETLGLYANLRPAVLHKQLKDASPLKESIIGDSLDILIVRELISGIYFGEKKIVEDTYDVRKTFAFDTEYYDIGQIERLLKVGFEAAMKRLKKVVVVDKANVLESSKLWRRVTENVAKSYPEVQYSYMYVDNAAMQLIANPKQFDVIITSNMFGDILSDEASILTGSIGMLPSASLGEGTVGLYEPSHGSAPELEGTNKANPIATILSVALLLRYSLGLEKEAQSVERAVSTVLDNGYRTVDICRPENICVGTKEMGSFICEAIKKI